MLRDPFLQARYLAHLDKLQQLAAREVRRTRADPDFAPLARLYQERLEEVVATGQPISVVSSLLKNALTLFWLARI